MIVEFNEILDSLCILVEGRERQWRKDVPSSRGTACSKALGKEGTLYTLRTDRSSVRLGNRVKERMRRVAIKPMMMTGPDHGRPSRSCY